MADLMSGTIQMMLVQIAATVGAVRDQRLRALAATGPQRHPLMPDVPTLAEQGFPGFSAGGWYGLLTPAGVPEEAIRAYHQAATAALAEPNIARRISDMGGPPIGNSPLEFRAHIQSEMERWRGVMSRAAAPVAR